MIEAPARRAICLQDGPHHWIVCFFDDERRQACAQLGLWAANPELPFNWKQAAVMANSINYPEREQC